MKIYTDLAFLDAFCQAWMAPSAFSAESALLKEVQSKFLHLLTNGGTVYCAGIGPNLPQYNNQLLLQLNQLNCLRPLDSGVFHPDKIMDQCSNRSEISIFSSGNDKEGLLQEALSGSGYFFFQQPPIADNLFAQIIVSYNRSKPKSWLFAGEMFNPHHSLIVADPHLYKEDGAKGLISLLKIIQPKRIGYPYWITLVGSSGERLHSNNLYNLDDIGKLAKTIEDLLGKDGLPFRVETFVYNGKDFHDRYIITNNLCVLPGYGVSIVKDGKEIPFKEGTWTAARPFSRVVYNNKKGVYFEKVMHEKLKTIRQWIGSGDRNGSGNPLL